MDKITTTIKRQFLAEIVAGTKKIEYREIKPYWKKRLGAVTCPFILRLINGMSKKTPEVTVQIKRITKRDAYELRISKIIQVRNWPSKRRRLRN
jgi:hypothetical protein